MTPREQNILAVLNVLRLLFHARKQVPHLKDEEQHTLRITYEHINLSALTVPVFLNTLTQLDSKGYLVGFYVFEQKAHPEIQKFLADENYEKVLNELANLDTTDFVEALNLAGTDMIEKTIPANIFIPKEVFLENDMNIKDVLDAARDAIKGNPPEVVATIVLSPFRSIERLLEKMNNGISFEDVKDAGIWYDPERYEFHFDDQTVSVGYQNKPNKEHFALKALFNQFSENRIDYTDIPEFEQNKMKAEKISYKDALNRFVKKHPRLSQIFSVHADHLAVHERYLEHPH